MLKSCLKAELQLQILTYFEWQIRFQIQQCTKFAFLLGVRGHFDTFCLKASVQRNLDENSPCDKFLDAASLMHCE